MANKSFCAFWGYHPSGVRLQSRPVFLEHPGQRLLEKPPPPRKMKPTLVSAHAPRLEHILEGVDRPLPTKEYRRLLKTVHTETVATTTQSYPPSGVLGTGPPPVNVREEKTLPRRTRRTLSQLRSGYSQHLLSYRARLEPDQGSSCPICHTAPPHDCPPVPVPHKPH